MRCVQMRRAAKVVLLMCMARTNGAAAVPTSVQVLVVHVITTAYRNAKFKQQGR
jgi:hypothetical protein